MFVRSAESLQNVDFRDSDCIIESVGQGNVDEVSNITKTVPSVESSVCVGGIENVYQENVPPSALSMSQTIEKYCSGGQKKAFEFNNCTKIDFYFGKQ